MTFLKVVWALRWSIVLVKCLALSRTLMKEVKSVLSFLGMMMTGCSWLGLLLLHLPLTTWLLLLPKFIDASLLTAKQIVLGENSKTSSERTNNAKRSQPLLPMLLKNTTTPFLPIPPRPLTGSEYWQNVVMENTISVLKTVTWEITLPLSPWIPSPEVWLLVLSLLLLLHPLSSYYTLFTNLVSKRRSDCI